MFNPNPTWERFCTFLGWSMQWNEQMKLFAIVPSDGDGFHPDAFLTFDPDKAQAEFKIRADAAIQAYAEDGKVCYVESGRDCDCVEYEGRLHRDIDATFEAYCTLDNEIGEWADGPYRLRITRPSMGDFVKYHSRDLVMEAYEDGHPHHITSRFP